MYAKKDLTEKIPHQKRSKAARLAVVSLLASAAVVFGTATPASAITIIDGGGGGSTTTTTYTPQCLQWAYYGDGFIAGEFVCVKWNTMI